MWQITLLKKVWQNNTLKMWQNNTLKMWQNNTLKKVQVQQMW